MAVSKPPHLHSETLCTLVESSHPEVSAFSPSGVFHLFIAQRRLRTSLGNSRTMLCLIGEETIGLVKGARFDDVGTKPQTKLEAGLNKRLYQGIRAKDRRWSRGSGPSMSRSAGWYSRSVGLRRSLGQ